jgi:uracil-DNA glycosylase
MGPQSIPPDRTILLASIRDYLEQLREEGIEGLPVIAPAPAIDSAVEAVWRQDTVVAPPAVKARPASSTSMREKLRVIADEQPPRELRVTSSYDSVELLSRYAGLEKTDSLEALREFIGACTRCKLAPGRNNLVFGVGNPTAQLMFIGEAPGADEDLRGEPFVGRAGQLLTDIIERGMGMSRADVYICNIIKCRPPENRNPEPDEVAACEPFLFRQVELVRPRVIVGLGTFAVHALLKVKTPISKLRGVWQQVRGIPLMPTFHPAYLLRNPADKRLVWADIQDVMKLLGQPVPPRRTRS